MKRRKIYTKESHKHKHKKYNTPKSLKLLISTAKTHNDQLIYLKDIQAGLTRRINDKQQYGEALTEIEINELKSKQKINSRQIGELISKLQYVRDNIESMKRSTTYVTEHAIVRYLERVLEMDMEGIRNQILTQPILDNVKQLGNGIYPNEHGFKVVVRDNTIVSIYS